MSSIADPEVQGLLEEAQDDLADARALASSTGAYHAACAAEKFLRALACVKGRQVGPAWDLNRVYGALSDLEGMDAIAQEVKVLAEFSTPAKAHAGQVGPVFAALQHVLTVVFPMLGLEPPSQPLDVAPLPPERVPPTPPRYERRGSVLLCERCGVRLPRTRQTAVGKVLCPHCGRPMVRID